MHFSVKRDFISIFLLNAFFVLLICMTLFLTATTWFFWIFFGIIVIITIIYNSCVIFASCDLDDDYIIFRTGMFKYVIPFNEISRVDKSKNIYSSLALSYDRIRVLTYNSQGKQKVYYIAVDDNDKLMDIINLKIGKKSEAKNEVIVETKNLDNQNNNVVVEEPQQTVGGAEEKKETPKKRTTSKKTTYTSTKKKASTTTTRTKKSSSTKKTNN